MLSSFSWVGFLVGVAFALFIWPMLQGFIASFRARSMSKAG